MELAGLVIGGISLTAMFTTTITFCECIRFGKTFGQDYETALTKLHITKLRLSRWAEAVRSEKKDIGTAEEGREALKILERIKYHFEQAEKLSLKYLVKAKGDATRSTELYDPQHETRRDVRSLVDAISKVVAQRQKRASALQKTVWAVYDKEKFNRLIQDIAELVDGLIDLFPAERFPVFSERQTALYQEDMKKLRAESKGALKVLAKAAGTADTELMRFVNIEVELAPRHVYIGNEVGGRARARFGDEIMSGFKIDGSFRGHVFHRNKVDGDAVIHYGDSFGGGSILDR